MEKNINGFWCEKYEVQIGKVYNTEFQDYEPKHRMIINRDQFNVIETFADIEMDEELNKIYTLNKCKFKVAPYFDQQQIN